MGQPQADCIFLRIFSCIGFWYFIIPFALVFALGLVLFKGKGISFGITPLSCGLFAGLCLGLFVALLEGLREGTEIRAIASGVVTALMVLSFFFGRIAIVPGIISGAVWKLQGLEITKTIQDELDKMPNKGDKNGR